MFKLVAKDFRITRLFWVPALFSAAVILLMAYESAGMMLSAGIFLALILNALLLLVEDRHHTDVLYGALPVTRRDVVIARYLSAGTLAVISMVLLYLVTVGIMTFLGDQGIHLRPLTSPGCALVFFVITGLLMSLFFPLFFRHGFGKAVIGFLIICLAGSIVLTGFFRLLEPALAAFVNRGGDAGGNPIVSGPALIVPLIGKIQSTLGLAGFAVLTLAATALAVAVSMCLSIRFYERRDL